MAGWLHGRTSFNFFCDLAFWLEIKHILTCPLSTRKWLTNIIIQCYIFLNVQQQGQAGAKVEQRLEESIRWWDEWVNIAASLCKLWNFDQMSSRVPSMSASGTTAEQKETSSMRFLYPTSANKPIDPHSYWYSQSKHHCDIHLNSSSKRLVDVQNANHITLYIDCYCHKNSIASYSKMFPTRSRFTEITQSIYFAVSGLHRAWCPLSWETLLKSISQFSQMKGISPSWASRCLCRRSFSVKLLLQRWQKNTAILLCTERICAFKFVAETKVIGQYLQDIGGPCFASIWLLSPVLLQYVAWQ